MQEIGISVLVSLLTISIAYTSYFLITKFWKKHKAKKRLQDEIRLMKIDFDRMLRDTLEKRAEDKDDCECESCQARRARAQRTA